MLETIDHAPAAFAVAVPIVVAPSSSVIFEPASAVPLMVGVVTLVMWSALEAPLSEAVARTGTFGAAGAVVSTVTASAADATLVPLVSIAFAVIECFPLARVFDVIDQAPAALALSVPTSVAPSKRSTVALASALPENVGAVTLVTLSVLERPLSEAAVRSGALGAGGTGAPSVIARPPAPAVNAKLGGAEVPTFNDATVIAGAASSAIVSTPLA